MENKLNTFYEAVAGLLTLQSGGGINEAEKAEECVTNYIDYKRKVKDQDVFDRLMKERRPRMLVKPSCSKNSSNEFKYKNVYDKKRGII